MNIGSGQIYKDSSGNVGIGTSSPTQKLDVNGSINVANNMIVASGYGYNFAPTSAGLYITGNTTTNYMAFNTSSTERMRIDSSGNLLVGTTSQYGTEKFNITQSATNNPVADFVASNASFTNDVIQARSATAAGTTFNLYTGWAAGTSLQFLVRGNGNTANTNNSFGAISDVKLKENIVDATPKLFDLLQVKIRNYNLIADKAKVKQIGVIAQELETVFPGLIEEIEDRDPDGNDLGTKTKSVKYSVFVPMLIKAIQELSAKNDALEASNAAFERRLAALENK